MSIVRPEDVTAFHRDGTVLLKGVLDTRWLADLEACLELVKSSAGGKTAGMDDLLTIDHFAAEQLAAVREFILGSPIAECVGRVLSAPVRFYMDQAFFKPAGEVLPTPWHQDTCYYNIAGNDLVRAWASPDAVPGDRGIEVIRGSHLWNVTYRPWVGRDPASDPEGAALAEKRFQEQSPVIGQEAHEHWSYERAFADYTLPELPDVEANRGSFDILGWDYEPGDLLLFHGNIVHSARGNVIAELPRRALATMWAGPDVHYLHRRGQVIPDPSALYQHCPADGDGLEKFPDVFPLAWQPASSVEE